MTAQWVPPLLVLLSIYSGFSFMAVPTRIRSAKHYLSTEEYGEREWTLQQDWALQDAVSKYTVGEATFWTQLWLSSPELSSFREEELRPRFEFLKEIGNATTTFAGDSPLVIEQWTVDEQGKLTGTLNGRTIWFTTQLFGIFGESRENNEEPQAGGFVEALGGRVYELGQPMTTGFVHDEKKKAPNLPNGLARAGAVVAASLLSATIGFNAGTSTMYSTYKTPSPSKSAIVVSTYKSASVSERRASTEARVLGERRLITNIEQRLQKDKTDLKQLEQEEAQGISKRDGASANDPSVPELHAKKEARVLREQRRVKNLSIKLEQDQVALNDLKRQERAL